MAASISRSSLPPLRGGRRASSDAARWGAIRFPTRTVACAGTPLPFGEGEGKRACRWGFASGEGTRARNLTLGAEAGIFWHARDDAARPLAHGAPQCPPRLLPPP